MPVRVAVIGCGWWSTYAHLPAIAVHPDAELVALVDPASARLAAARAAFPSGECFDTTEAMLDAVTVDAAVVAVPHAVHHPVARLVLERGIHTLLEKPMVLEPAHGRELVALARARGAELLVDYPWHYNTHVLAIRDAIAAGRIGPIEHVSCLYASTVRHLYAGDPEPYRRLFGYPVNPPDPSTYGDPALAGGGQGQTQVTHAAALLLWLTGVPVAALAAYTADFELPVDLTVSTAFRFVNGATGVLSSTGSVLAGQKEIVQVEIFGRDGHVRLDVNEGRASIHHGTTVEHLPLLPAVDRNPEHAPVHNLIDIAAGRTGNGSPSHVGLGAVEFVSAMYRSARTGSYVRLSEERS
ncbi:Gfo/Idh/MocA family protein [Virgisporangium aurantiacum]|uniref:Oxidoreductase n=1 Tax=Virgisporangium aurantiacum TaxID=175570 RepID=A0A8J3ZKJ0_9ACTN|nr:Gfo/Idh/MocA family oxidoreductase [Virgisporangium aurantiacum]GIJ63186.1 hypothetical protein Vau01_107020 [Virgisporangium aurantiacum]